MARQRNRPAVTGTRILDSVPPASGAVVMGTGIVSIALLLDHHSTVSDILLVLDAIVWVALAGLLPARALADRARFRADVRCPSALTSIAGTAVLGTRLTVVGWEWAGAAFLIVATGLWLALVPRALRHWQTPTVGASFPLTVATESLALLGATLAAGGRAGWLLDAPGTVSTGSGALGQLPVTWASRTEQPDGKPSPEELIAAAHATCFAMALSPVLGEGHTPPERLTIKAECTLDQVGGAPKITKVALSVRAPVPRVEQAGFATAIDRAAALCPVSNALRGNVEIDVRRELEP